ncbi:hypothetical protein ROHU_024233 [Labeo rohita]|uniref:Uncharacterized protein n=1 Tax=Labeo rohita TaxID=84645 RepID=A0A498MNV0_LABRO|nr:hypothetical protein ROHU_024233 [Labeo rohita]
MLLEMLLSPEEALEVVLLQSGQVACRFAEMATYQKGSTIMPQDPKVLRTSFSIWQTSKMTEEDSGLQEILEKVEEVLECFCQNRRAHCTGRFRKKPNQHSSRRPSPALPAEVQYEITTNFLNLSNFIVQNKSRESQSILGIGTPAESIFSSYEFF